MNTDTQTHPAGRTPVNYEAPRLESLGTLAELTRGGTNNENDSFGGAGSSGFIPPS